MEGAIAIQTREADTEDGAFEDGPRPPEATVADGAAMAVERWDTTPMTAQQMEAHTAFVNYHYGQRDHMGG